MTQREIWLRGVLITGASVLSFLNNDPTFRSLVPPVVLTVVGALTVGFITLRAYVDKSPAEGSSSQAEDTERAV